MVSQSNQPTQSVDSGPSDWFEPLYARADGDVSQVPWALPAATPMLTQWIAQQDGIEVGTTAVVVGCGLGNDAEALAAAGYTVTAFDISESAIAWAKRQHPDTAVEYVTADLFNLPDEWKGAFDLVFEFRTLQALPLSVRGDAIRQVAELGKTGGTVVVATYITPKPVSLESGPPWPMTIRELKQFENEGLVVMDKKRVTKRGHRFRDRMLIQYRVS